MTLFHFPRVAARPTPPQCQTRTRGKPASGRQRLAIAGKPAPTRVQYPLRKRGIHLSAVGTRYGQDFRFAGNIPNQTL
jgi:hypothetical protein